MILTTSDSNKFWDLFRAQIELNKVGIESVLK